MAENLKTATLDTSLPSGAFMFGADSQSAASPSVYAVDTVVAPRIGEVVKNSPLVLPTVTGTNIRQVHPMGSGLSTTTVTVNRLHFQPGHFYKDRTLTECGVYVGTLAASGVARIGLYEDAGGVPGAFVADFGEVSTATTGYKSIAISQAVVSTKWYWWGVVCGTANPALSVVTNPLHAMGVTASTNSVFSSLFVAHTYGALPTGDQSGASFTRTTGAISFFWL